MNSVLIPSTSDTESRQLQTEPSDYRIAWWAALAITIHIIESALPSPLPGIKPGLANVIVVAVLMLYGWRDAAWVAMLRVLVGSLLIGTFLTPTFMLSLAGALASISAMGLAYMVSQRLPGWGLGAIGYSVLAAQAHMLGQFSAAYLLLIPHPALFKLLPLLLTAALGFGVISGMIAAAMIDKVEKRNNGGTGG